MRILIAGDTHGDGVFLKALFRVAVEKQVEALIVCGDFGYWGHTSSGRRYLELARHLTEQSGITLLWADGNHENFDILDAYLKQHPDSTGPLPTPSSVGLLQNVLWVPRGHTFSLGGKLFMGFGGADSIDKQWRVLGESYWLGETIKQEQVDAVPEQRVDILITHEAPLGHSLGYKDDDAAGREQRRLITEVAHRVHPAVVYCGHHHQRVSYSWPDGTQIEVLADSSHPVFERSFVIIDV
jgi:Icc-related predicted phosphoesterase